MSFAAWVTRQDATAVRNAVSMALPLAVGTLIGQPALGGLASIGAFTAMYTHNRPYRQRWRRWAYLALLLQAAFVAGALAAGSVWAGVIVIGVVAAVLTYGIKIVAIGPPAAYLLVLACATGTHLPPDPGALGMRMAVVAAGSVVAVMVCSAGWLLSPDAPERLAVSAAVRSVAGFLEAPAEGSARARHQAYRSLHDAAVTVTQASRRGDPGRLAAIVRELRHLVDRTPELPGAEVALRACADDLRGGWPLRREVNGRWTTHLQGYPRMQSLLDALTVAPRTSRAPLPLPGAFSVWRARTPRALRSAARVGVAATAAGCVAIALGVDRPYWGAGAAVAVLAGDGTRATVVRAGGRFGGTVVGVFVAAGILLLHPSPLVIVLAVFVLQFMIQLVVTHSYGLAVVAITPLALLLADAATGTTSTSDVVPRLIETTIGCLLALVARAVIFPNSAAKHLPVVTAVVETRAEQWGRLTRTPLDPALLRGPRLELERGLLALSDAVEAARDELVRSPRTTADIARASTLLEQTWPAVTLDPRAASGEDG